MLFLAGGRDRRLPHRKGNMQHSEFNFLDIEAVRVAVESKIPPRVRVGPRAQPQVGSAGTQHTHAPSSVASGRSRLRSSNFQRNIPLKHFDQSARQMPESNFICTARVYARSTKSVGLGDNFTQTHHASVEKRGPRKKTDNEGPRSNSEALLLLPPSISARLLQDPDTSPESRSWRRSARDSSGTSLP